jgi:hypothetical protein
MKEIKHKLNVRNLIHTRADKRDTIVILDKLEYDIINFINDNDFTTYTG